jgi:hypothetical protein
MLSLKGNSLSPEEETMAHLLLVWVVMAQGLQLRIRDCKGAGLIARNT